MASEGADRKLIAVLGADAMAYIRLTAEIEVATVDRIMTYREFTNYV